jgi:hypothetical protein
MTEKLSQVDLSTHLLALAVVLTVAFFVAFLFAGAVLYERTARREEEQDPDPAEIDATHYPDMGEDLYR